VAAVRTEQTTIAGQGQEREKGEGVVNEDDDEEGGLEERWGAFDHKLIVTQCQNKDDNNISGGVIALLVLFVLTRLGIGKT
jgi:hypothetical protein